MPDFTAKRTLVKSPPELWEELSEVERLAKHLGAFGDIKITKLEPEHTVAWEGEHASGTVSIEPSGWGTKVTLHAELPDDREPEPDPIAAEPDPAPAAAALYREPVATEAEPEPVAAAREPEAVEREPEPEPLAVELEPVIVEPVSLPRSDPEPKRRGFLGWLFRARTGRAPGARAQVEVEPERPVVTECDPVVTEAEPLVTEPESVVAESESVVTNPEPEPVAVDPEPVAGEPEPLAVEPEPEAVEPEPDAEVAAASLDPARARLVLDEALDALGAAHHRPFSRS